MGTTESKYNEIKQEDESLGLGEEFTDKCINIKACKSLKRLISILKFHSTNNSDEALLQWINTYNNLLNDYHHILYTHLNNASNNQNKMTLTYINQQCVQNIQCTLNKCQYYQRNNRNRCKKKITDVNCNSELLAYTDILDAIHVYFMHSFDTGFRVQYTNSTSNNTRQNHNNTDFNDKEMTFYRKEITSKRKNITNDNDDHRFGKTKFVTDVSVPECHNITLLENMFNYLMKKNVTTDEIREFKTFISDNEYDSCSLKYDLSNEIEKQSNIGIYCDKVYSLTKTFFHHNSPEEYEKQSTSIDEVQYSFGQKFYYEDKQREKYWYIDKLYKDLKEEISQNKIFCLPLTEYMNAYNKAVKFFNESEIVRKYVSTNTEVSVIENSFGIHHIVAVLLYTDFTDLSYNFSKSFRKLNSVESDEAFKQRKREFYWWSKILTDTVELFGTMMVHSTCNVFYTGISRPVTFNSFIANFYSPTSTTRHLEVAMIFASDKGMILELERLNNYDNAEGGWFVKHFNCSLFSAYTNEDEHLFIGGFGPLQFRSIRMMKNNANYFDFINALKIFNTILDGEFDDVHKCKKKDVKVIDKLIRHELKMDGYCNKYPQYVNNIFHQFAIHRKNVTIAMSYYTRKDRNYTLFSSILFSTKCQYLLNLSMVAKLFGKLKHVLINYQSFKQHRIDSLYLRSLEEEIECIKKDETNSLQTIRIFYNVRVSDHNRETFKNALSKLGWYVHWNLQYRKLICSTKQSDVYEQMTTSKKHNFKAVHYPEKIYFGNLHQLISEQTRGNNPNVQYETKPNYHVWTLFMSAAPKQIIQTKSIEKVIYNLHPTYRPSKITVNTPPFYLKKTGWGTFSIDAHIVFKTEYRLPDLRARHMLNFANDVTMTCITNKFNKKSKTDQKEQKTNISTNSLSSRYKTTQDDKQKHGDTECDTETVAVYKQEKHIGNKKRFHSNFYKAIDKDIKPKNECCAFCFN